MPHATAPSNQSHQRQNSEHGSLSPCLPFCSAADGVQQVQADAVVLATGGFSASKELLAQYSPLAAQLPTTNGPWASGDGIKLGQGLGEQRCTAAPLHSALRCRLLPWDLHAALRA